MPDMCPYFDDRYDTCKRFGTHQDEYQVRNYCCTTNYRSCANYPSSYIEIPEIDIEKNTDK